MWAGEVRVTLATLPDSGVTMRLCLPLALFALAPGAYAQDSADTSSSDTTRLDDSDTYDDGGTDDPKPTRILDGTTKGSVEVTKGEVVWLTGTVTKDVTVDGGVLVVDGGEVQRDLLVSGGEVDLIDAVIGRDLEGEGGTIEVGMIEVGRNIFVAKLDYQTTSESLQDVFGSFGSVDSARVTLNGTLVVGKDVTIDAGDTLSINGTVDAGHDVSLRSGGDLSVEATSVKGESGTAIWGRNIDIDAGDDLSISGSVDATGEVYLSVLGGGTLDGTITANHSVTFDVNGDKLLEQAIAWVAPQIVWENSGDTDKPDEVLSCGKFTYTPTYTGSKVAFYQCLNDSIGG